MIVAISLDLEQQFLKISFQHTHTHTNTLEVYAELPSVAGIL